MKKLVFGLIATVLFMNFSIANPLIKGNLNEIVINLNNPKSISEDQNFIDLVLEMENFSLYIYEAIKDKNQIESVKNQLEELNNKSLDYNNQLIEIDKIFNSSVSERVVVNMNVFSLKWKQITSKYKYINNNELTDAYGLVVEKLIKENKINTSRRGWRYSLCIVAAGAGAVLCHAACDTTALATTAGLGIPACIALCGTLQVFASVQCYDNYGKN